MIEIEIPGFHPLIIEHLVLDYNGSIALDGSIIPGVKEKLDALSENLKIHVITADTFGSAEKNLPETAYKLHILEKENQAEAKLKFIRELGAENCVSIGNGRNDRLMLEKAALGIVVIQGEGAALKAVRNADILCGTINDALELLLFPRRLVATLRS